jgi:hypothetical protein
MRIYTSNPYAEVQSLAPAKPAPAPHPRKPAKDPKAAGEARQRLADRMRRAANPWEFD